MPVEISDLPPGVSVVDETGDEDLAANLEVATQLRELAYAVGSWAGNARAVGQKSSMFNRLAYSASDNPYDHMRIARHAVRVDDVVGGVADVTESLMFDRLKFQGQSTDNAEVFNQIAAHLDLDNFVRMAWRETYTLSQVVVLMWWAQRDYRMTGYTVPDPSSVTPVDQVDPASDPATQAAQTAVVAEGTARARRGNRRRKTYTLWAPSRMSILDATKVVPIGMTPYGTERLAWHAVKEEMDAWAEVEGGTRIDPIMSQMFVGKYTPTQHERSWMAAVGIDGEKLLELNPVNVWRHNMTTPDYLGFPEVRLQGCFSWLDVKQQLMEADRAFLVGAANYILVIKKGSDASPARPEELANLKEGFKILARLPVIVSDHRLTIEIITPKIDMTLDQEKYNVIDNRLMGRALGALSLSSSGQRNENTVTISRFIGRTLESRRHMLKRALELHLVKAVIDDPRNKGVLEADEPNIVFVPQRIELGTDANLINMIQAARASRDLSRESYLEFAGFDQEAEAQRMTLEQAVYDPIFKTQVPYSTPGVPSQVEGGAGGRPDGGGDPAANATKTDPKNPTPAPKGT